MISNVAITNADYFSEMPLRFGHRPDTSLVSNKEASQRIETVVCAAKAAGVTDFGLNARTDVIVHGSLDDAIDDGRAYLDAGASSAFVWC